MSDQPAGMSDFERRLAEKEAARAAANPSPAETVDWSEFAPEIELTISPEDEALDRAIAGMNIVEAYNRWCKKMVPNTRSGRQREGIKVSCPNPAHPDKRPSAWLNTDRNLYYCPGCALGGDVWDIAAWHFGYNVPHYKHDAQQFRELREKIGTELGFQTVRGVIGTYLIGPEMGGVGEVSGNQADRDSVQNEAQQPIPGLASLHPVAGVSVLPSAVEEIQNEQAVARREEDVATIDWRSMVPEGTFLRHWLEATTIDDCPEEYHFWTGLMAIGFAVGRNRLLMDARPVMGNLFICFVGPSGAGKSSAKSHLTKIIQEVIPYKYDDPLSQGVKHVSSPGSAEYVVKTFSAPVFDPMVPKKVMTYAPVRAQVDFEELSSLIGISNRQGSTMKPVLLELYDGSESMGSGSLTHGDRTARQPFGQATSTTQDGSLKKLLDKSDEVSGFMNRWVFASGKLKRQRSLGGAMIDLKVPSEYLRQMHQWASTTQSLGMSADAYTLWDNFFHEVLVPVKRASENQGSALLNRIDLLMKKLVLLLACNQLESEISANTIEQAISLYPYLLKTYGFVKKEISTTEESFNDDQIVEAIRIFAQSNQRAPSVRDLHIALKRKIGNKQLLEALKNLVLLGAVTEIPSPAGQRGRPTVRYAVND